MELSTYNPPKSIPSFDPTKNKIIPIPLVTQCCKNSCCDIKLCPLTVAFGRTIQTFQGKESGPGKPINTFIFNHVPKSFEGINPGTFYSCITRATTLGKSSGEDSEIYFTGQYMIK